MSATLEELERRLVAVERELAVLKGRLIPEPPPTRSSESSDELESFIQSVPMLRKARENAPLYAEAARKMLKDLGITGKPLGAEALQKMLIAEGLDPTSNEFSQGIIDMREE